MAEPQASERRRTTRVVPAQPLKVAIESEKGAPTVGVVADISDGGACVWTNAALGPGDDVLLRLSTARQEQLPATGRVVWKGGNGTGVSRYGIEWTHAGPPRVRLRLLIGTLR
jgi:Tfp pilus assembly protein PilZ